jgi:hypothetical protein
MRPMIVAIVVAWSVAACGHDHGHEFDNLPECVDEHSDLGEPEGIAHCLIDFPELHPDFADQQACVDWVTDEGYADSAEEACMHYFEEQ